MKTLVAAFTLAILFGSPALVQLANAAPPMDAARQKAVHEALVGPALLVVAVIPAFAQVQSAVQERRQVAQFCAPPDQEGSAPRFYCQDGPARASHQSAQQNVEPGLDTGTSAPRAAAVPMLRQ